MMLKKRLIGRNGDYQEDEGGEKRLQTTSGVRCRTYEVRYGSLMY